VLGNVVFADTGLAVDSGHAWSGYRDAEQSYRSLGPDIRSVAADWERRSLSFFSEYYRESPQDIAGFGKLNGEGGLELAVFVGWQGSAPQMYSELIRFDARRAHPIYAEHKVVNLGMIDLSTNNITEELIDRNTNRAKQTAKRWSAQEGAIPDRDRPWRYLSFLIKETNKIDSDVSRTSDVVEIPLYGSPRWIQRAACKAIH
jgi:hypothetical protein